MQQDDRELLDAFEKLRDKLSYTYDMACSTNSALYNLKMVAKEGEQLKALQFLIDSFKADEAELEKITGEFEEMKKKVKQRSSDIRKNIKVLFETFSAFQVRE
jgi:hypothetical protein